MHDRQHANLSIWQPSFIECVGSCDIPIILPVDMVPDTWIPFNYARTKGGDSSIGVHMFLDDYQIERLWRDPARYAGMLSRFACVCAPDFSLYRDTSTAINLYNHYRKHWLAAWWQRQGISVLPTICWGDADSFAWCFDGEPAGAAVAVSSVGTQRNADDKAAFMYGYDAMLERLSPSKVYFWGNIPKEARGNIQPVECFHEQVKRRCQREKT